MAVVRVVVVRVTVVRVTVMMSGTVNVHRLSELAAAGVEVSAQGILPR
jgi:hypothetical protein